MRTGHPEDASTVELVAGMIGDARDLAVAHLDGMRLEMRQELADLKASTRYAAIAIAGFAVAAILFSFGLVQALWLYTAMPSWAAYLMIAAVFAAIGAGALIWRRRRVSSDIDLFPETAIGKLRRDVSWVARGTHNAVT